MSKTLVVLMFIAISTSSYAKAKYAFCDTDGWPVNYEGQTVTYQTGCFKMIPIGGYFFASRFCSKSYADFINISERARSQNVPYADDRRDKEHCDAANPLKYWLNNGTEYDVLDFRGVKVYRFYSGD